MADGSVKIGVGLSISKAERDLEKLKAKINDLEDDLNERSQKRSGIEARLNQARSEAEKTEKEIQRLNDLISEGERFLKDDYKGNVSSDDYNRVAGAVENLKGQLAEQEKLQKTQLKDIEKITKEYGKADAEIEKGNKSLEKMQEQAGDMEKAIAAARPGEQLSQAIDTARGSLKKFLKYAIGIRSAFILFRRLKGAITDSVKAFAEYDDETKNNIQGLKDSLQALKLSWGAAFAPIFNVVAPLIQKFIGWITNAANAVAKFMAIMTGKSSYKKAIVNNNGMADSLDGVAESAAEAQAQLMGFDELNILNAPSNKEKPETESNVDMVDESVGDGGFVAKIKENLEGIELLGFNALLGVGLALLLTGANIPLGLGLVAAGAIGLAKEIAPRWEEIQEKVGGSLSAIVLMASGLMLGIGAVLAFSGANVPLGLGLIAAGVVGATHVAAINWDLLPANVLEAIAKIDLAVGVASLAIGAILAFTGINIPLGIAMMLAGGALIGAGLAVEWNALPDEIKKALGQAGDEAGETGGILNGSIIKSIKNTDFSAIHNILHYKIDRDIFGEKWAKFFWSKGEYAGKDIVMSMINGTDNEMPSATTAMSGNGQELGESYEKGIISWASTAENSLPAKAFGWIAKKVKGLFKSGNGKSEFEEIGEDSGAGVEKGLKAWEQSEQKALIDTVFGGLIKKVRDKFKSHSPSQVFYDIGKDLDAGLEQGVKNNWSSIPSFFETAIDKIKRLMNFTWSFPKPKLPHFTVTWQDLAGIISIPHISVQWYAKGGIFDTASLIGVGEAGKEAVVPLERNTEWINLVANSIMDRMTASDFSNRLAEAFVSVPRPSIARGTVVPPNAISGTFGGDWNSNIMQELTALRREISALAQRPIEVDTTLELDRRVLGKAVTRYQAGAERAYG